MKSMWIAVALALFGLSPPAWAWKEVGNGGGAWVCRSAAGNVSWIEVIDLYEAQKEFQLEIPAHPEKSVDEQILSVEGRLATASPPLSSAYQQAKAHISANHRFVSDVKLELIHDYFNRIRPAPSTCPQGQVGYEQLANFTNYGELLIDAALWGSLSTTQQAALLVHEAVYSALRDLENAQNSIHARRIVGLLFSSQDPAAYSELLRVAPYNPDMPSEQVLSVETGSSFACALFASGRVKCWGDNRVGQLGDFHLGYTDQPVLLEQIDDAAKVVTGVDHGCVITTSGRLKCWGANDAGQLGLGFVSPREAPAFVALESPVLDAIVGYRSTCAALADGSVRCWGANLAGALPGAPDSIALHPVAVPGMTGVVSLWSDGWSHCAIGSGGRPSCWGSLGALDFPRSLPPVSQVRISDETLCLLGKDRSVWCRGEAWSQGKGCSGDECGSYSPSFVEIPALRGASSIAAGRTRMHALTEDGRVLIWNNEAVRAEAGDLFRQISSSYGTVCGLHLNGQVKCWEKQLGKFPETASSIPVVVQGL